MAASHILIVVIIAIALTIFAERRGIQAPLLLAGVGLAASFLPGLPSIELSPEVLLGVVVPPLLYSAAQDFSFFSFIRRLRSILNLGVLMVAATAFAVAGITGWLLPAVTVPVALILGAVVAPPDAVSAVAIGGKLGLPRRLMTVLKGESLINDAAALTIFTLAVATATGTKNFIDRPVPYFLYAFIVGMLLGVLIGGIVHLIRRRLTNPTLITALAIVTPFAAYAIAEELGASGVMAVVFAGFSLGHNATDLAFAGRIQEREVWRVIEALLEAFVFAYMGLQFRSAVADAQASGYSLGKLGAVAAILLLAVILVRIAWVMATAVLGRRQYTRERARPPRPPRPERPPRPGRRQSARSAEMAERRRVMIERRRGIEPSEPLSWRENVVLAWTGMRGVVTVAAAAGTPLVTAAGGPLAGREIVMPLAFAVAIGTLLLQGLTLPALIRRLHISGEADASFRREQLALAREIQNEATLRVIGEYRDRLTAESDLRRAERLLRAAQLSADFGGSGNDDQRAATLEIMRAVLAARRAALIAERNVLRLDDEILRELLEEIDLQQAVVAKREPAEAVAAA